jgi:hypothetical protein
MLPMLKINVYIFVVFTLDVDILTAKLCFNEGRTPANCLRLSFPKKMTQVRSKINSLENAAYKPGGGEFKKVQTCLLL